MGSRVIIGGALERAAAARIDALTRELSMREPQNGTLQSGSAGHALLFAYAHRRFPDRGWDTVAQRRLDHALATLADAPPADPWLVSGLSGIAWVAAHLGRERLVEAPDLAAVDETLLGLVQSNWPAHYDLLGGLGGIALYACESPHPLASSLLEAIVRRLDAAAEHSSRGATWRTEPARLRLSRFREVADGILDLGVAHGAAGLLTALATAALRGTDGARRLLDEVTRWLIDQRLPPGSAALFPWHADGVEPARAGWCYGDPGIAAALAAAGDAVGDASWLAVACDAVRATASATSSGLSVRAAGLCHGVAGLAHLFGRLYRTTGNAEAASMARLWLERAVAAQIGPEIPSDLFNGAVGVALALLGAIDERDPSWDRVLAVSVGGAEQFDVAETGRA
ncbi:MAG: Lanthionine biosynthesis cyclase LanC [Myxococcales bacterium]|nr:Lanthionine biosynthesis cyclase LanC [Myxococcales bacterium]